MKANASILKLSLLVSLVLMIFATACQKKETVEMILTDLGLEQFDYTSLSIPSDIQALDNMPTDNPTTNDGAALGRVLFYDKALSLNGKTACASCHLQSSSFSDVTASSTGFTNGETSRNAPMIFNARFHRDFLWDARADILEKQVLMPIKDHLEMGMEDFEQLENKIERISYYPGLFEKAFGSSHVSKVRISMALAQFVRSIASFDSKWDQGRNNGFQNFTAEEMQGKLIFDSDCASCHTPGIFGGQRVACIGLDVNYADNGVGALTNNSNQNGVFKVPSLRNIQLTAPYMHDGRFSTLEEVVAHYNEGIQQHQNLDLNFMPGGGGGGGGGYSGGGGVGPITLGLTKSEEHSVIAFLKTLTDLTVINDPKFADPFLP